MPAPVYNIPSPATVTRHIRVAEAGADFTSLRLACAYRDTFPKVQGDPWLIQVFPNWYTEDPWTIPAETDVVCMSGADDTQHNRVNILCSRELNNETFITFNTHAGLSNCFVQASSAVGSAGECRLFNGFPRVANIYAKLISQSASQLFSCIDGAYEMMDCRVEAQGVNAVGLRCSGGTFPRARNSLIIGLSGARYGAHVTSGTLNIDHCTFGGNPASTFVTDLNNAGGVIRVNSSYYRSWIGAIHTLNPSPGILALAFVNPLVIDASVSRCYRVSTAVDFTINAPTSPYDEAIIALQVTNTAGTDKAITLNTGAGGFLFTSVIPSLLPIPAGKTAEYLFVYSGLLSKWRVMGELSY